MDQLEKLLIGLGDPFEIAKVIRNYTTSRRFADYAEAIATKMVTHLYSDAGRTWRQAARKNSRGRMIYEALQKELQGPLGAAVRHQIERNAAIIRSVPLDVSRQVTEHVGREVLKGTRAIDIAEQIKTYFPDVTKAKAGLIARTETSKTSTALTQARSELIGVDWYVWRTSEDTRVRSSHRIMEGVLIRWSNPPSPELLDGERRSFGHYHAGNIFNCRCYPEPVIDLDLIQWPAKVYYGGTVQRMSRKQFEKIA
ncbi:phage minor head protein [Paenibacillus sp. GCM10012303]|uniref:phage head morphogenesis protein n=1 Tax=Paenibacillus sp. GCM10012303 TaxID=3317340 RepID=UPI00361CBEF3